MGESTGMVIEGVGSRFIKFHTNSTERMRLDSSGNLLVGHTSQYSPIQDGGSGITLNANGQLFAGGQFPSYFNREDSDGEIVVFRKDGTTVGSIGVTSSDQFWIARATGNQGIKFKNSALMPSQNNGTDYDNAQDLGSSSVRWKDLYLSGGVVFGTTGGTVTSKTLDDYEEGTWTPTYTTSGAQFTSVQYGLQAGHYTKVGRMVIAVFRVKTDAVNKTGTTGTSNIRISGLPFTPAYSNGLMGIQIYPLGFNPNWLQNPQKVNLVENDTNLYLQQDDYNSGQYSLNHPTTVDDVATVNNSNYAYGQVIYNIA